MDNLRNAKVRMGNLQHQVQNFCAKMGNMQRVILEADRTTAQTIGPHGKGSAKDIRWRRRRGRESLNALEAGIALRSSVLPLISSAPAKMNYPIMHLQHNSISLVRQYIETSQQCKMETTKIVSSMQLYSQLDKHVSWLAASAINDDRSCRSGREQEIEVGFAASKALNKSCPRCLRRPRHLMSLVLPHGNP